MQVEERPQSFEYLSILVPPGVEINISDLLAHHTSVI